MENPDPKDRIVYMQHALIEAQKSPPKPTNYRVGAILVDLVKHEILATGYTLELEGNTHAEQCCFMKLAKDYGVGEDSLHEVSLPPMALYTTVEPCSTRLSGNLPCVERILRLKNSIKTVYVGVLEPSKFIANNNGRMTLQAEGITVIHVPGLEKEILATATAGHQSQS
jgi:pyrimidine deaminase RibD-like protein